MSSRRLQWWKNTPDILVRRNGLSASYCKRLLSVLVAMVSLGVSANAVLALPWVERLEGGSASIQNSGDTSYRPARVGEQIRLDEAVLPSPRSLVVVRCPNNTRSNVVPGQLSNIGLICPDLGITKRSRNENDVLLLNSGVFPYELRITDDRPTLMWPAMAGVETYQVSLYQSNTDGLEKLWQGETAATSIEYDGSPLSVDVAYSVIVEPQVVDMPCGEAESDVDRWRLGGCFRANLQRLDAQEDMALTQALASVEAADFGDDEIRSLALAYAYREAGAYDQVIGLVVPLVEAGDQPAAVHELLADSYLRAGWIDQAQTAFADAERLATLDGSFQTRLVARLGLVKVMAWQMQSEVAIDYLWAALRDVSYRQDQEQADVILQWIGKLK